MTENDFLLQDRITKIKTTINYYNEKNFYIGYSGGKDSTILSEMIDIALPNNKIPRVYIDTGIELETIKKFVKSKTEHDNRFIIVKPTKNIREILEKNGYPFKSKSHSEMVSRFQTSGELKSVLQYQGKSPDGKKPWSPQQTCPKILLYQFNKVFNIKISDRCCIELKEKPIKEWAKKNNKTINISGIRKEEGGRRRTSKCVVFNNGKLKQFNPLSIVTSDFIQWFIDKYKIKICDIYNDPYNFERTGCKGCPFNVDLQNELEILKKYFPNEYKQCEIIWKPIYEEYRRIGYRLKEGDK